MWHSSGLSAILFPNYIVESYSPCNEMANSWMYSSIGSHKPILEYRVMFLSFQTDRSRQTVQTQIRGAVWSGSTLFAIPSASFGCITQRQAILFNFQGDYCKRSGVGNFRIFPVIKEYTEEISWECSPPLAPRRRVRVEEEGSLNTRNNKKWTHM